MNEERNHCITNPTRDQEVCENNGKQREPLYTAEQSKALDSITLIYNLHRYHKRNSS